MNQETTDRTHITVILDRTGSMDAIRDDTIGGFNAYLSAQKAEPGYATMTLVQFDSQDPYEVIHQTKPIQEIPPLTCETYVPRASTPLLDALGCGMQDLAYRLSQLGKEERPEMVIFVVVTDGLENASTEFRKDQIVNMVARHTTEDKWQFVFLSADLAAIQEAREIGFAKKSSAVYRKTPEGTAGAWSRLSKSTSEYRSKRRASMELEGED